jgi:hypothetical protein
LKFTYFLYGKENIMTSQNKGEGYHLDLLIKEQRIDFSLIHYVTSFKNNNNVCAEPEQRTGGRTLNRGWDPPPEIFRVVSMDSTFVKA